MVYFFTKNSFFSRRAFALALFSAFSAAFMVFEAQSYAQSSYGSYSDLSDSESAVLSTFWTPEDCIPSSPFKKSINCNALNGRDLKFIPQLHGYWPSTKTDKPYSGSFKFNELSKPLQKELNYAYYGDTSLIKHEWKKHGKKSGMTPEAFFTKAIDEYKAHPCPEKIYNNAGKCISYDDVKSAYSSVYPLQALMCNTDEDGQYLTEIRIYADAESGEFDHTTCDTSKPVCIRKI